MVNRSISHNPTKPWFEWLFCIVLAEISKDLKKTVIHHLHSLIAVVAIAQTNSQSKAVKTLIKFLLATGVAA